MKIATVLGTRPEIIRLSQVIKKLDCLCNHTIVHTGQNYDTNMSDIFFDQLSIRQPDIYLDVKSPTTGAQIARILEGIEQVFTDNRPDRLVILGDTNSALVAVIAKRMGIPVYHMEAGNRCFDDRVPEEVNRRVIDHCSDIHMPYTERSRYNLLAEGIKPQYIFVTGNPIYETISHYLPVATKQPTLTDMGLEKQRYMLVTVHRAETVNNPDRLRSLFEGLVVVNDFFKLPVIVSTHPNTRRHIEQYGIELSDGIKLCEPFAFFDFLNLELNARCVMTDSGTVQEECSIFNIPNVTLRDTTERPETIECGSNMITGVHPVDVLQAVEVTLSSKTAWQPPENYMVDNVSEKVVKIILGM